MALRELVFDLAFRGDANAVSRMDNAVTGLAANADRMGRSLRDNATRGSQAFASGLGNVAKDLGKLAVAGGVAFGALATKSIFAASEVEEMQGKFNTVFKGMENDVAKWAETQAKAMGRSKYEMQGYLAESQNMFVGMGMTREAGADLSKQIATLGIDLASFNNLQDADAIEKLNKAVMGETESAKSLGAVLNENTLAASMEVLGIKKKFQALTEAEKMQVRYNAIVMQSGDAMGDAERTSGSFANQMKALKSGIGDTVSELGQSFLPTATAFINKINENMPQIKEMLNGVFGAISDGIALAMPAFESGVEIMQGAFEKLAIAAGWVKENFDVVAPVLVSVGLAIGAALIPAFIAWTTATWAQVVATWALAAPILAIMAPIIAVGVAIGAAIYIWKNWGTEIKATVSGILTAVGTAFTNVVNKVKEFGAAFIGGVKNIFNGAIEFLLTWSPLAVVARAMNAVTEHLFNINLFDAGKNILKGLMDGMLAGFNKVKETAQNIASGITDKFKSVFKINSPSKVFAEMGKFNIQGLSQGMEKEESAMGATASNIADVTTAPLIGNTTNSNSSFSPTLNISVNGDSNGKEAVKNLKAEWENLMRQYQKRQGLRGTMA